MRGIRVILLALLATTVFCIPERRLRRSYDNARGRQGGYGIDSDEHDGSVDDHGPCDLLEDNSSSPERGYEFDEPRDDPGRGFSVRAAAAASSSTY